MSMSPPRLDRGRDLVFLMSMMTATSVPGMPRSCIRVSRKFA
jgi:hypothetical protein